MEAWLKERVKKSAEEIEGFNKQRLVTLVNGQAFERLPACKQRVVAGNRPFVCHFGSFSVTQHGFQVPLLLPGTAIGRAQGLESVKCFERAVELFEVTLADGEDVQGLIVIRTCIEQVVHQGSGSLDSTRLQQLTGLLQHIADVLV